MNKIKATTRKNSRTNLPKKKSNTKNTISKELRSKDAAIKPSFFEKHFSIISFLKYIFVLVIIPPILNLAALHKEFEVLHPEGERVNMGLGQKMFISCKGEGLPTVILDAPTGKSSDIWLTAQKEIANFTQVCIYDRSGLGYSDRPFGYFSAVNGMEIDKDVGDGDRFVAEPSSVKQMVNDLYLLTLAKSLPKPFILVGSEIGGLVARYYAQMYPKDVTDVILLDPMVESLFLEENGLWGKFWNQAVLPFLQPLHLSALSGVSRISLLAGWLHPEFHSASEEVVLRQKYVLCSPSHMLTIYNEYFLMNSSFLQMRELWESSTFPESVSITVLNSNYIQTHVEYLSYVDQDLMEIKQDLAELNKNLNESWRKSQQYLWEHLHPGCQHHHTGVDNQIELFIQPAVIVGHIKKSVNDFNKLQDIFQSYMAQKFVMEK